MTQPMKVLSLSADGELIIPDEQETKAACNAVFEDDTAVTLIFYPIMARNTHRKSASMFVEGVQGAADCADDAGSDVDEEMHDFGGNGELNCCQIQ